MCPLLQRLQPLDLKAKTVKVLIHIKYVKNANQFVRISEITRKNIPANIKTY